MMALITGGAKCGKSALAEHLLDGACGKIYIATMIPYGQEAQEAILRHRKARAGKGFQTLECCTDLAAADVRGKHVLLECLGNLCANELFREPDDPGAAGGTLHPAQDFPEEPDPAAAYDRITAGIASLKEQAEDLIIVTNQTGADGMRYEAGTMAYIRLLGAVNEAASRAADLVIECVYGIPVILKDTRNSGTDSLFGRTGGNPGCRSAGTAGEKV